MNTATKQVTYINPFDQKRMVLIDNVDAETAQRVAAKWGSVDEPYFYLPGVQIEDMPNSDDGAVNA